MRSTGTYTVRVYSYARGGRYVADVSVGLAGAGQPDRPPSVAVAAPVEGAVVAGVTPVQITATADAGIRSVEVAVDTGPGQDITNTFDGAFYTYSWDTRAVGDGGHTVTALATDTGGREGSDQRHVTVQNRSRVHRKVMAGRVSAAAREVWFDVDVAESGYLEVILAWPTGSDLDFYVYGLDGQYLDRAYTLRNPEQLRVDTERIGTGNYRIRVHLFAGPDTDLTLTAVGTAVYTLVGTVTAAAPSITHTLPAAISGSSRFVLGWIGQADLDFYVYEPTGLERGRAYTLRNPEILELALDVTGGWRVRVHLYSGPDTPYSLRAYLPAAILD